MLPTFRTRITGVSSLAVALLLALAFGVIYVVVRESSYSHLDEDISAEYEEALNNLDWADDSLVVRHMPEWEEAEHQQIEVNPTFVQVVDRKGMLRFKSANLRQARFLYRADASSPVFFNDTINSKWLRLGQFPLLNDAGRPLGYVTIGISGDEAHAVLTRLRWTLGLSFAAVVLILFGVLWYAASVAIYPIRRLIAGTEALDEKDLQARLTVPTQVHETEQLAQAMNALLDRLELNIRQQKQFVADVSHELRTPLTAIKGTLEVVLRKPRSPEQYAQKLKELLLQTNRLQRLYDGMLLLARVEAQDFGVQPQPMQIRPFLEKTAAAFAPLLTAAQQTLSISAPLPDLALADPGLLELALNNILSNAVKYNRPAGHISVVWEPADRSLSVTDKGPGIEAADLPHIFERFYRADPSRSAATPGHGIGLSVVRKVCDLQGIALAVTSSPGCGATFSMTLPPVPY